MVGDPTSLDTSYMLACFCLHPKRSHSYGGGLCSGLWHLHLDTSRVLSASFPFPWETPCTIYSMAVITSTRWTDYDSSPPPPRCDIDSARAAPALFGGALLGYVIYDCTHYYLHHGKPSKGYGQFLRRYHLNHHFKTENKGFGITSSIWDHVFGTFPATKVGVS
ncbi:hypothetical protein V6N13_030166 [Hibiscus sabdariffa]|uniref:Fatty acid hydroxylase domain-containing protein n=2 Tax=Hibiscus sabdariffa TaxID=183260 RepID=A0ABR2T7T2_9ROSI